MNKKNLSKTQITKRTGLHHQVIERYMNNTVTRFDRDVLAKLCFVLECDLNEIIKYIKPNN